MIDDSINTTTEAAAAMAQPGMSPDSLVLPADEYVPSALPESLEALAESLQDQLYAQQIIIYVLFGLLLIGIIVLFVLLNKYNKRQDAALKQVCADMMQQTANRTQQMANDKQAYSNLSNQLDDFSNRIVRLEDEVTALKSTNSTVQVMRPRPTASDTGRRAAQNTSDVAASTPGGRVGYFTMTQSNGQLSVKDRNILNDDSRGWFMININGDTATYDINTKCIPDMLANTMTLKECANDFEPISGARGIKTVQKGNMRKDGGAWVVTKKITIQLY